MKCNVKYLKTAVDYDAKQKKVTATVVFRINVSKAVQYNEAALDFDEVTKYLGNYGGTTLDEKHNQIIDFEMSASTIARGTDEYDPELGKHIALSKVQEKVMLFTNNFYFGLFNAIEKQFDCLLDYSSNAFKNAFKEFVHHQKLGGGNVVDLYEDTDELVQNAYEDYLDFHEGKINGNIRQIKSVVTE